MGKRKAVWGGRCKGGKGRWCQKAVRNKAKLNKREKKKHRTVTGTTTKTNKTKLRDDWLITDTRMTDCISGLLTGSTALTGDSTFQNTGMNTQAPPIFHVVKHFQDCCQRDQGQLLNLDFVPINLEFHFEIKIFGKQQILDHQETNTDWEKNQNVFSVYLNLESVSKINLVGYVLYVSLDNENNFSN